MRLLCLIALLAGCVRLGAADSLWDSVTVAPMKTSIYVGSVTLTTGEFLRKGDSFVSTYEARVRPWFFWSEHGRISIVLSQAELERLAKGERVEFTGEAFNQKNKPRTVSGRADRIDVRSGKLKIRISVDDTELIFNGSYQFGRAAIARPQSAQ